MVKNYFDLVPIINNENTWIINEENIVVISADNKGLVNRLAIKYLKKPEKREIELDGYGSFVWQKINGKSTVYDIINAITEELGEEKELAAKRAAMFFEMLRLHKLINFINA